jgi:hypothetical protein
MARICMTCKWCIIENHFIERGECTALWPEESKCVRDTCTFYIQKALIDPGKCNHHRQYYSGVQETLHEPLYLWTCFDCGTTKCGEKPKEE